MHIPLPLLIGTGAVIFLANAGLLVLQLVAGRLLAPFIGSSVETWTSVIGVFLTGIALGNWLGGRLADRFPSPKTVSVLLVVSGLASLGMIGLYELTLSTGFYKAIPLGLRIPSLAFLFCLLPALFLSLLTPLTIKLALPDVGSAGRISGIIFALSTLGCLVGNYCTGFWLMAEFTLHAITAGVGFGLIALALPMLFLNRVIREPGGSATGDREMSPAASGAPLQLSTDSAWDFRTNIRLAYAIVFLASFCGMSLELTGSRVLAPIVGVSLFTWTGIIGVMLAGTASGNYLGGLLADRGIGPALRQFALLAGALVGAATMPLLLHAIIRDFDADDYNDYLLRFLGAAAGVLTVLPGFWLSKRRQGRYVLTALAGGIIGTIFAHPIGRSLDGLMALNRFTQFHQGISHQVGFSVGPWLIHGLGFAIGAAFATLFVLDAPKQGEPIRRTSILSGSLFAAGLSVLVVVMLTGLCQQLHFMYYIGTVERVLAWTFSLFFLPMLLLGTISPQVIRLSVTGMESAGRVAGSIYAWSTIGAIAGTFTTGYFLISSVGTFRVLMLLAFVLTLLAFFVGQLWKNNAMLYAASVVAGGAIFGMYVIDFGSNRFDLETKYYAIKVDDDDLFFGERVTSLTLDHLKHSFLKPNDPTWLGYKHEYVQGEILDAVQQRNQETFLLVIGGGGYTFPRYVETLMPNVHIDVVEIDPGVTEIAHRKLGLPRDTTIQSFNMDGRQFVSEKALPHHYQTHHARCG